MRSGPTLVNLRAGVNHLLAELDRFRYLSLATFRRDGAEVRTPVWFAAVERKLYVFTAGDSGKAKRLRRSARARVAPCDARGGLRGEWREATARLVDDRGLIERARAALRAKYGWQLRLLDVLARLAGRIDRRAWIEIEYRGTGHRGDSCGAGRAVYY